MFLSLKVLIYLEALYLFAIFSFKLSLNPATRRLINPSDIALLLSIPIIGLFGHDRLVFFGFVFLIPLLSIGKPDRLLRHYIITLLVIPELSAPYVFAGVYLGLIGSIIFLNAGALTCLALTQRKSQKQFVALDCALWLVFLATLFIFARGGTLGGVVRASVLVFFLVVPPYYVISRGITSSEAVFNGVLYFVFGCFCNAVIAIFECTRRWPLYQAFYNSLHVEMVGLSATLSIRAGLLRATGAIFNYETLGLITGLSLVLVMGYRARFGKLGRWFVGGVLAFGCFASQARSAWIATIVGLVFYCLYTRRWTIAAGIVAAVGAAFAAIVTLLPSQGVASALVGTSGHGQESIEYRSRLLSRGMEEFSLHPLFGQTLTQLQSTMRDLVQGEHIIDFVNTHLLIALVGGIGLLALWFIAWLVPLVTGWRARHRLDARQLDWVAVPVCMIVMCFVVLSFTSPIDRMIPLVVLSLGFVSVGVRYARTGGLPGAVRS